MNPILYACLGLSLFALGYCVGMIACCRWVEWLHRRRLRRAWRELGARSLFPSTRSNRRP